MKPFLRTLFPFLVFLALALALLGLTRLGLLAWQQSRLSPGIASQVLLNGTRVDLITVCMILFLPILMLVIAPLRLLSASGYQRLVSGWLMSWFGLLVFMECVTPAYMEFFHVRPGRIFFEYLNRPGEVAGLIAGGYPVDALLGIAVPAALLLTTRRWFRIESPTADWRFTHRLLLIPVLLVLVVGGRGSLGHRPANPSTFAIAGDQMVNDLALNSTYRLLYAVYSLRHEEDPGKFYPEMAPADIIATVREDMGLDAADYVNDDSLQRRFGTGHQPARLKNLLIIVEESLGARFVGALGGLPLTPQLDSLADEGIWFERLYATGIRSARGLEAIVAGFPPSPSRSVLKLGGAQQDFYTLAQSLAPLGYRNHFIYGGEAHFDNMQGFFLGNGFDEAIDQDDYDHWQFKGTWGVSDEDLFQKTHEVLNDSDEPVFAVAFTSSFHSPFEFPPGKIELYEEPQATRFNAVKYADHALGQFLDQARGSDYWENTLVLIVADHDERPRGYDLVPISSYHIPGVILGGGVEPQRVNRIASQIDLIPTLVALMGISGTAPLLGEDVLSADPARPGMALMQYGDNHAYLRGNRVVIHRPGLPAEQYHYDPARDLLEPQPLGETLAKRALAWALLPGLLYGERLYKP